MIFILHYILFSAGLANAVVLLTIFLQVYAPETSLSEIGTLLMILPFVSILVKPLCCALADRQQAHKTYFLVSLGLFGLGYGSLVVAPFFPDFIKQNARLVWYLDVLGIIVGYSAFGVIWSLGDALALNAALAAGVPWGSYRAWATFSWGIFGWIQGQINETELLPRYTPGFMLLIGSIAVEFILVVFWPSSAFDMSAGDRVIDGAAAVANNKQPDGEQQEKPNDIQDKSATEESYQHQFSGGSSARMNPRLVAALANMVVEDIGSGLKSSLRFTSQSNQRSKQRTGLAELVGAETLANVVGSTKASQLDDGCDRGSLQSSTPVVMNSYESSTTTQQAITAGGENRSLAGTLGRAALRRTQLGLMRMNSLSSTSGMAIADEMMRQQQEKLPDLPDEAFETNLGSIRMVDRSPRNLLMSTLRQSSQASLGRSAKMANHQQQQQQNNDLTSSTSSSHIQTVANFDTSVLEDEKKVAEDLQIILLKIIVRRDSSVLKYLILFTFMGMLLFIHLTYFFMHVEKLCREKDYDFSSVVGALLLAQSISEIFTFVIVTQYYMPKVGRLGSVITIALVFTVRYAFYATYYVEVSPYWAVATESCHGIAYGIIYTLVTDLGRETVNQLDDYLPELIQLKIVDPRVNPSILKLSLRATMQGIFSGAFDGLGNGIGVLFAGIYLDYFSYCTLWYWCTGISICVALVFGLTESLESRYQRSSEQCGKMAKSTSPSIPSLKVV